MAARKRRWPVVLAGVVVLLVVAGAVAVWRLDAWLTERAQAEAATWSQKLGRPLRVGEVDTRLFPHLGATVSDVVVGPAEGEELPLLTLPRLEVDVLARPLLASRGKDIQVRNAEVRGLTLQVVRLPDGTTNLERLQQRLEQVRPKQEAPAQEEAPTDLSGVRVDRAALVDGLVRFVDRSGQAPRELSVSDIDVEVRELRAGEPLEVRLAAAVLASQQNVHATLQAAPLPPTLLPTPEQLTLKVQPIDLTPLAPFFPDAGLQAGTVQADWSAKLGAAVPGGSGPTRLQGSAKATGLRFAGAEGGKALDVTLLTDVTGDVQQGSLALHALELVAGPARLTGKGKVEGLLSGTPRMEGFELVGRNLDPAQLAAYYPPLRQGLARQVSGPLGLEVRGEGTQQAQTLTARVDLTPVRLRIPEELSKEAGAPMTLVARLSGAAASGGPLRFSADLEASGADLRPGTLLDKPPGQPFAVRASGRYRPAQGREPLKVEVGELTLQLLQDTLKGSAAVALAGSGSRSTTTFSLALHGPRLDADRLLMDEEESRPYEGPGPEAPKDPARFNGMRGDIRLEVAALRYEDMDLQNVRAELKMVDDLITVERFDAGVFGGSVAAGGSSVRLGPAPSARPFTARVQVKDVNVAQALATTSDKKVLTGTFDGGVDLTGVGYELEELKQRLVGGIQGEVRNGSFLGLDVLSAVTQPLARALPFTAKPLSMGADVTRLAEQLPFSVTIEKGVAQLKRPITWTRPEGKLSFDGGIRLDGTLALAGTVELSPQSIRTLTLGKVTPSGPIPLALQLSGPAWKPQVQGLDVKPAALAIGKQAAASAATGLLGEKGKAVQGVIEAPQAAAEQARKEAEQRAAQEKARLEQQARQQAEAARKKAEEEAKKKLRGLFGR